MTSTLLVTDARDVTLTRAADALSVPDGAFCYDPATRTEVKHGYTLAAYQDAEQWMSGRVTSEDILAYEIGNEDQALRPGVVICGWRHPDGAAYLYLARVTDDYAFARDYARHRGDVIFTDLSTGAPVRTGIA